MEDNYSTDLLISKNDYICRLINILTPQLVVGIKSILESAIELCNNNSEEEKYLMTFQNFLAQIPSWNQTTIEKEKQRIIDESGCDYLEDLITCIHLIHFKIVTSINPGRKNAKKIDLDIPRFDVFIHQSYCEIARKLWSNIFLFHVDVEPLEYQKNAREIELIIKDSIINTIRNNIPIRDVINTYLEESEEYLENYIKNSKENDTLPKTIEKKLNNNTNEQPENDNTIKILSDSNEPKLEIEQISSAHNPETTTNHPETTTNHPERMIITPEEIKPETSNVNLLEESPKIHIEIKEPEKEPNIEIESTIENKRPSLKFNNNDEVLDLGSNNIEIIEAPKDIPTLEKKEAERKDYYADDDDDDKLTIGDNLTDINLSNDIVEL